MGSRNFRLISQNLYGLIGETRITARHRSLHASEQIQTAS